MVLVC